VTRLAAVAAGIAVDRWCGEPPTAVHPVAWFGRGMARVEHVLWRDRRDAGVVHAAIGVGAAWLAGCGLRRLLGDGPATLVATAVCVAGRMLDDEALAVGALLRSGDLAGARLRLRALVGRDTSELDAHDVARAVVESVAENTTDAVVAPALWAAALGAPGVLAHRAANTLDAMVGHHSARYRRFGWASARLDDVVNAVPAIAGVALVTARHPRRWRAIGRAVVVDARHHPSPNAGLIEGAFAAALGIGLGGANRYGDVVEDRGRLGSGRDPVAADIARAVRLRRAVGIGTAAVVCALEAQRALRSRPSRRSQLRLVSSSHPIASASRSVVAT
jgi:adenosylcobinamide-phosphate synthase